MCADWLRAMFDKSTDHGNDVMVVQFVFFFLLCKIFAVKPSVCGFSWVFEHFDFISIADKRTDVGK